MIGNGGTRREVRRDSPGQRAERESSSEREVACCSNHEWASPAIAHAGCGRWQSVSTLSGLFSRLAQSLDASVRSSLLIAWICHHHHHHYYYCLFYTSPSP